MVEDKKIKLCEEQLEYKKGFKWYILPYSEIAHAYLRIEEVNGRLCCGVASFDMYFLMLRTIAGEEIKIEVSLKESAKEMLGVIEKKNPETKIGYKKQEKEGGQWES